MMNKILDSEGKFVVYDNVLDEEKFRNIWNWVQNLRYTNINSAGEFMKIWKITDGNPMASEGWLHSNSPFKTPLDIIHSKVLEVASTHPAIFGDWKEIVFRSYIYGRGTKINWHNDPGYSAALIFHTHPTWSASWGGELQLAETPEMEYDKNNVGGPLENWWTDRIMGHLGCGYYVQPKPNRIVATKGGIWHCINRVDDDAGINCRCSIVAFFKPEKDSKPDKDVH